MSHCFKKYTVCYHSELKSKIIHALHNAPHNVIAVMSYLVYCHEKCSKYLVPDRILQLLDMHRSASTFREVIEVSVVMQKQQVLHVPSSLG